MRVVPNRPGIAANANATMRDTRMHAIELREFDEALRGFHLRAEYFRRDLATVRDKELSGALLEDGRSLIRAILTEARTRTDIPGLIRRVVAEAHHDVAALNKLGQMLDALVNKLKATDQVAVDDAAKDLSWLDTFLGDEKKFPRHEIGLRFELAIDPAVVRLLELAARRKIDTSDLKNLVEAKLQKVPPLDIARLWSNVMREFRGKKDWAYIKQYDDLPAADFFDASDNDAVIARLAEYAVSIRPALVNRMVDEGTSRFPMHPIPIAKLCGIRDNEEVYELTDPEREFYRALCRSFVLWDKYLRAMPDEFLRNIGLAHDSKIKSTVDVEEYQEHWKTVTDEPEAMFLTLTRLLSSMRYAVSNTATVESALRAYRLSLEAAVPESKDEIVELLKKGDEPALQRHLARFLIERGIHAVGTKFGNSQTDLVITESGSDYVVEAKVYREDERPTGANVSGHLQQLSRYMTQSERFPHGVLALFNFSDRPIRADSVWLRERFWILPINLCSVPPSETKTTLRITPTSSSDAFIDAVVFEKKRKGDETQ